MTPLSRILNELAARDIPAKAWRMGGSLHAAGLTSPERTPAPGISACISTPDGACEDEAIFSISWDAPATRDMACALMMHATRGGIFEDGGDDELVFCTSLEQVMVAAKRFQGLMR